MLSLCRPLSRRVLRWRKPCLCCLSRHPTVAGNADVSEKHWLSSPKRQRFLPSHHARDPRLSTPSPWAPCWTSPTPLTRAKPVEVKWMIRHVMWLKIAPIGYLKSLQKFPLHYVRVLFQNSRLWSLRSRVIPGKAEMNQNQVRVCFRWVRQLSFCRAQVQEEQR